MTTTMSSVRPAAPVGMPRLLLLAACLIALCPARAWPAAEVKLDRDFLSGLVEKVPPSEFKKEGKYRGTVQAFRLVAIDSRTRRFLVSCQIVGEYRPPVQAAVADKLKRDAADRGPWKNFRFDLKVSLNVEPGRDGTPRFHVEIEEVKRRELEGIAGGLAKLLGKSFDELVTQVAAGNASRLGDKLNSQITRRVKAFQEYGVFCAIDYASDGVVLHFDVTRFKAEGTVGHVFAEAKPGTVPLYRWFHPRLGFHLYTTSPAAPGFVSEGIACHVYPDSKPATVPLYRRRSLRDVVLTASAEFSPYARPVFVADGVAGFISPVATPDTVPFYQFVDPRNGRHFYTTHKYAEFAK